jgi:hypothetical protein
MISGTVLGISNFIGLRRNILAGEGLEIILETVESAVLNPPHAAAVRWPIRLKSG